MVNIKFVVYKHLPIMVRTVKTEGEKRTGKTKKSIWCLARIFLVH